MFTFTLNTINGKNIECLFYSHTTVHAMGVMRIACAVFKKSKNSLFPGIDLDY